MFFLQVRTLCELVNNAWVPITSSQNAGGFAKAETHWSIKLAQNALFEAISDPSLTSFEKYVVFTLYLEFRSNLVFFAVVSVYMKQLLDKSMYKYINNTVAFLSYF